MIEVREEISDGRLPVLIDGGFIGHYVPLLGRRWEYRTAPWSSRLNADDLESIAAKLRELNKGAKTE